MADRSRAPFAGPAADDIRCVPFWLSLIMVVIGVWIRLGILETPIFQRVLAEGRVARVPVVEVFKRQPKKVFLTAFARMAQMPSIFVYTAFVFTHGPQVVHLSRDLILLALLIGFFMQFLTIPLWGFLSNRLERKRVYICGAIATGLFAFAYFAMFNTAIPAVVIPATMLAFFFHDMMWGPAGGATWLTARV